MSRIITFSTKFPSYHPRVGEDTNFVEKFLNSIQKDNFFFNRCCSCGWMGSSSVMAGGGAIADTGDFDDVRCPKCLSLDLDDIDVVSDAYYIGKFHPKGHTIRKGSRWKPGDKFSPRVWSGDPYDSKQITIAPDVEVKKAWSIEIFNEVVKIDGRTYCKTNDPEKLEVLARNDGLSVKDLMDWFKYPQKLFDHQIICWDESIEY